MNMLLHRLFHCFGLLRHVLLVPTILSVVVLSGCGQKSDQPVSSGESRTSANSRQEAEREAPESKTDPNKPTEPTATSAATPATPATPVKEQPEPFESDAGLTAHQQMIRLMRQIAKNVEQHNPYLGDGELKKLEQSLALLTPGPSQQEVQLNTQIGFHAMRVGDNDKAIKHLERALNRIFKGQVAATEDAAENVVLLTALAWLRKAEIDNCLSSENAETCIFPITREGISASPEAAEKSMSYLTMLLKRRPRNLTARWLLNIAAMSVGRYPDDVPEPLRIPTNRFDAEAPLAAFENISRQAGTDIVSLSGGMIADDFDLDGRIDMAVSDCHPSGQLRILRNIGDNHFADVTSQAGIEGITGGLNLIQADFDNDGLLDIFVLRGAWLLENGCQPNSLLHNLGDGRFEDITLDAGLAAPKAEWPNAPTQTGSWSDFDLDGDLDLCVGNEKLPLQLYRNDSNGQFVEISESVGLGLTRFIKGVIWGDYDHDGDPDLYISCLDGPNLLFRNDAGKFTDVAESLNVQKPLKSFATWFWDYNNDGHLDLFVTSYAASVEDIALDYLGEEATVERMTLYEGDGGTNFRDVTSDMGLHRVAHPMGSNFGDLDNDGFQDFHLATGDIPYQMLMPNLTFYNRQGNGFADVTALTRTGHLQKGHGVAFADFDKDGDQDMAVELGGAFRGDLFQNALFRNPGSGNHWITIRLFGKSNNRFAVGAKVSIRITEGTSSRMIHHWMNSGGTFGASPLHRQIGLGSATQIDELTIEWPGSGTPAVRLQNIPADQIISITESSPTWHVMPD